MESAPSEADRNNAISNSICTGTRRFSETPLIRQVLVRHGVSPTTQISYTYEYYRMRQSKTEFTRASPKNDASVRNGKQSLPDSCYIKNVSD